MLPNLIVPGAGKSGTSSLHEYLDQHPDIFMSRPKEPHFFSNDGYYRRGLRSYSKLFADSEGAQVRGESSTTYLHFPRVTDRIHESLADVKFIFLLRNPIDRIESHYLWLKRLGFEDRPFCAAFLADFNDEPDFRNSRGANYCYYAAESRYGQHVRRFIDTFGRARVYVLTAEKLRAAPADALASCATFLSVAPFPSLRPVWANATADQARSGVGVSRGLVRPLAARLRGSVRERTRSGEEAADGISSEERAWLREIYEPEVTTLRRLVDHDFHEWESDFPLAGP
jgi:hypothetical protein